MINYYETIKLLFCQLFEKYVYRLLPPALVMPMPSPQFFPQIKINHCYNSFILSIVQVVLTFFRSVDKQSVQRSFRPFQTVFLDSKCI